MLSMNMLRHTTTLRSVESNHIKSSSTRRHNFFLVRYLLRLISYLQGVLSLYSCDQLEPPDVTMDSYAERLTAVRIHKQGDWLRLGFISCVIDCCWHNSCQWRKWQLTNDELSWRRGKLPRLSAKPPGNHPTSLCLSQCLFTATLNHCQTDNTAKTPTNTFAVHTE